MQIAVKTEAQVINPIPLQDFIERQATVQAEMARQNIDLIILTSPDNVHYLTGYQTEGPLADVFLILLPSGRPFFVTRTIDLGNLFSDVDPKNVQDYQTHGDDEGSLDEIETLFALLAKHNVRPTKIGMDLTSLYLTVIQHNRIREKFDRSEIVEIGLWIDRVRWIKSENELKLHRAAGIAAVKSMQAAVARIKPGVGDGEVASAAIEGMVAGGGEWIANWPHIRTGHQSGLAHRTWRNVPVESGQPTILELCGVVRRYHTPFYRTVVFKPTALLRSVAETARDANQAGQAALRPGVTTGEVFSKIEAVIKERGHGPLQVGRNGYMVGIAFQPSWIQRGAFGFSRNGSYVLQQGMVFHFLTLLIKHNEYAIGESSTIAITANGMEDLTPGLKPGPILFD